MDLDRVIKELSQNEKKVLLTLQTLKGKATPQQLLKQGEFTQEVEVMNAASWLQSKKLITIDEHLKTVYSLANEGKRYLKKGLPEKQALHILLQNKGKATLNILKKHLDPQEIPIAIGWMKKKHWATIKKEKETTLEVTPEGKKAATHTTPEEHLLQQLKNHEPIELPKSIVKPMLSRKNILKEKGIITSTILLTPHGKQVLEQGFEFTEEISQITSETIRTGEWKQKNIRPYDIHAFAPARYGGKPHPLIDLIGKIRRIFLEMGFEEIHGDFVESSFWNMDVLFIPQDHPAREMQDTLYCKTPATIKIKDKKLLEIIAEVHKNGGKTRSTGWGYTFSPKEGERALLRTHTTVNTIRYLYQNPKPPAKVFSIERVFRKENIDATHLPEFYQIEGIIHEKDTNFRQLIGVLKEFYRRMGFEKIRFRPGYFPYTEPSMEVEVFWNREWMELGGSGLFRPEVTEPVGVKNPVLAWGLGLERLAMMKFDLTDMRSLYTSDLDWLRKKTVL
jgi:phenylalanyl-tRNA synthetase alpha chain